MKSILFAFLACVAFAGCASEDNGYGYRDGRAYDVVCGAQVNEGTPWRDEYHGHVYYFHDMECRDRFRQNPQAYMEHGRYRDAR